MRVYAYGTFYATLGVGAVPAASAVQTDINTNRDDADPTQMSGANLNVVLGKLFLNNIRPGACSSQAT